MRPEGVKPIKIPVNTSGIEPATFRLVAQFLKQLHQHIPRLQDENVLKKGYLAVGVNRILFLSLWPRIRESERRTKSMKATMDKTQHKINCIAISCSVPINIHIVVLKVHFNNISKRIALTSGEYRSVSVPCIYYMNNSEVIFK